MKVLLFVSWHVKAWTLPENAVQSLRARFPQIEFVHARTTDEAMAGIVNADAALASRLTSEMVAAATRLQWVHSSAVNVNGILPVTELAARGITITNSRGIQGIPIAETVMGGLLMLGRRLDRAHDAQRRGEWIQNALFDEMPAVLSGKRMVIVGLGGIGMDVAKRAHAFGMTVIGVRRNTQHATPSYVDQVFGVDQLKVALAGADVLVIAAPSGGATERLIGAAELSALAPGATLVNVARASIVDQSAILSALNSGALGGAVLDVFEQEPLPGDHPLWSMSNVVITPHAAGFNARHWNHVLDVYADNIERFQAGTPLRHLVDPATGY